MTGLGKIAIIGAGAVGGYYGAKLARVHDDVHFLFRSNLNAVRHDGLEIRSHDGNFHLSSVHAYGTTQEMGLCDLVIIALKSNSNAALLEHLPPLLQPETILLTLQNGLGNEKFLAKNFGSERILGGVCFVCLNRTSPNRIENYAHGDIAIAEFGRPASERLKNIADLFIHAGVRCHVEENLSFMRWRKLVWNIPFNGLTIAHGGIHCAQILSNPELLKRTRALMEECAEVAGKLGHPIADEFIQKQIDRTYDMGPYKPSSLLDYLAKKPVEIEAIWGEPLRRAQELGVATPELETLYSELKTLTQGS